MKNELGKIALTLLLFFTPILTFSQEMSNEKYQKIIVMNGEKKGWLEVFVDPLHFGCECNDVIKIDFKPSTVKNTYKTEDNSVTLNVIRNSYIITVKGEKNCCFIKPGKYN